MVAPEQLGRAILIVVRESYGIFPADVPNAVCRLLGFSRITDEMTRAVEPHRDRLLREGHPALQGVNLVVVAPNTSDTPDTQFDIERRVT